MTPARIRELLSGIPTRITMDALQDLLIWVVTAIVVVVAVRLVRRWVDREIEDVNQRHKVRKWVGYAGFLLVVAVGLVLFLGRLAWFGAFLAILGAGAAIALQDVAKNLIGWAYLTGRTGVAPGARVEVGGVVGEVIDVGLLKTTLLEVGAIVEGRQSSGRLATIPNAAFITQNVLLSPDYSPYGWQELQFTLTYESDWRRGVELLEEVAGEEHDEAGPEAEAGFRHLERNYAFKHGPLTPIVYAEAADSGVRLTLRYLIHIRKRRGSADRITRAVLAAVNRDPALEFAYPTWRVYRRGEEEATGGGGAASASLEP